MSNLTQEKPAFSIYNASAGAGKTFSLVSNYLYILLRSENEFVFSHILAITFTNKAVAEMKSRIIESLREFSSSHNMEKPSPMFKELLIQTGLTAKDAQQKSRRILKNIIQDYASFDVVTIDTFTHRIIRTFAHDLRISQSFEVELRTEEILEQAIANLIDQVGDDEQLTPLLIDYALEKTNEDRSWDISRDFYQIGRMLLNENHRSYLDLLKEKSLSDFDNLKAHLKKSMAIAKSSIKEAATKIMELIHANGLTKKDFNRGTFPNNIEKLLVENYSIDLNSKWAQTLEEDSSILYTKGQKQEIKDTIEAIAPALVHHFIKIKEEIPQLQLKEELLKSITPLSVLQAIKNEIEKIKQEKNLVLISEFNDIINKTIVGQPTPFIYERLGERYAYYFIDEFQDTSVLQWNNMIPLIDNALSSTEKSRPSNSLMIVGDPKQSIYRWRGRMPEQFIELYGDVNPFTIKEKEIITLEKNWRSHREVIDFNNTFFSHIAQTLNADEYRAIYELTSRQDVNHKTGGYVNISFVVGQKKEETEPLYLAKTLEMVNRATREYDLGEICILVRKNSEGVLIAQHLQSNGIPVVSNESLLLNQSRPVKFIISILRYILQPEDKEAALGILEFLAIDTLTLQDPHTFIFERLHLEPRELFASLASSGFTFEQDVFNQLPLYEGMEYILRAFHLDGQSNAHLQFFLDHVFAYAEKNQMGLYGFYEWWCRNESKLSISTPENTEAIRILTIHKSKGLEFPVVIYPFADTEMTKSRDMNWLETNPQEYEGFAALLISQNQKLQEYNEDTATLYNLINNQQQLDNMNALYVALTRAVERLYIITSTKDPSKPAGTPANYSQLFQKYLEDFGYWHPEKDEYFFGSEKRTSLKKDKTKQSSTIDLISTPKAQHNIHVVTQSTAYWENGYAAAIENGNMAHELLAQVLYKDDVEKVITRARQQGLLEENDIAGQKKILHDLINSLEKHGFYNAENKLYLERDLIYKGNVIRPDRVEITKDKEVLLLDYKTGKPQENHVAQINGYAEALEAMGYKILIKVIAYLNEEKMLHLV
ncbi:MAG: hypothetical protein CL868_07375 [Cytophagaceae bacterium]|nr:hypothetical protein [Cytophagaceae bacterium]